MRISDETIEQLLTSSGHINEETLTKLKKEQRSTHRPLQDLVLQHEVINDKDLSSLYATYAEIPFADINPSDVPTNVLSVIPERIARKYNAVVFSIKDGVTNLAMEDPDDVQAVDFIKKQVGNEVKLHLATKENILQVLDNYRGDVNEELSEVIKVQKDENDTNVAQVSQEDIAEDSPIAQTVNLLLEYAIRSNASDIHIEPREDYIRVRYRIDGVLEEANRLPRNVIDALISRIKILSNLKIDERRVPQDGRFKISVSGKSYALRVSTLPVTEGEKVALRILDESNKAVSLEQLGYWGSAFKNINEAIVQPHGMVLVTGPTGSGKSTSLFSILTILNKQTVNISTVEDPVEYKIPGINQTQVNVKAGMTFASGLRALLRQDPNIIMVGEIRDRETADLAVQAALTGHLVFSTLHTNNAATSLPRLLDMKIEPFLIASTIRAVIGQRLVRRICKVCRISYKPSPEEQAEIIQIFGLNSVEGMAHLNQIEQQAAQEQIGADIGKELSTTKDGLTRLFRAKGCDECNNTGYKGRIGIYEVLPNSTAVQKLIIGSATSDVLQEQAIKDGMETMQIDGLIKALRGETSIEETLRVTRE